MNALRKIFWLLNKFFMVPVFRLGFGRFMGNPITGYIMVIKTIGRKTGKQRFTPVNYAIIDGKVYCTAGFGKISHWYHNLQATPSLELILPGGAIAGEAETVEDPQEAVGALRQVLRNGGFAGFAAGFNPFRASDEQLEAAWQKMPVLRIQPTGIGSGAGDPQGWLWITLTGLTLLILWSLIKP